MRSSAYICGTPSRLFPYPFGVAIQAGLLDWVSLPICTPPPLSESNRGSCPAAHLEKVDGAAGLSLLGPLARHGPHISAAEIAEGPLQQFTATQSLAPSVAMDARPTFGKVQPLIRYHHSAQKSLCVGLLRLHFRYHGRRGRRQRAESFPSCGASSPQPTLFRLWKRGFSQLPNRRPSARARCMRTQSADVRRRRRLRPVPRP